MIYTVTFNPAVDYTVGAEKINIGGVNRTAYETLTFGGKGINVSAVLSELGVNSVALGFVAGETGKMLENMLASAGINTDFIHLNSGNTRINVKIETDTETDINARGPQIDKTEIEKLLLKLRNVKDGDIVCLCGSVPEKTAKTVYADIAKAVSGKAEIVVDAEGELLKSVLPFKPFLIKPNLSELGALFGQKPETRDEIVSLAQKLLKKGAQNVLVSCGKDGAVLITESGKVYEQAAPEGRAVKCVGAGDSAVAGFIKGYLENGDMKYALRLAVAAGSATAFSSELAKTEEIEKLMNI